MGFLAPAPPPVDVNDWKTKPHLERIKPLAQDWAVNGFGTPTAIYLLYVVKLVVFVAGAWLLIAATTSGVEWTAPIVFQKVVVWLVLWEIVGLGCGSMPLTFRFLPPIGSILYWLRPGTVRLPPWPDKVPLTRGTRRTIVDVLLYAGVLASGVYLLISNGEAASTRLDPVAIVPLLGFWALLGLRDKVSFLAGRPEVYGFMMLVSLFPAHNLIVGWQFVLLFIWWGAATSKLNRHFPYVISVMVSNTPWNRSHRAKARLYENYPEDVRPSRPASFGASRCSAHEFGVPLVLILSKGGTIGTLAVIAMILFHAHITSTFALG